MGASASQIEKPFIPTGGHELAGPRTADRISLWQPRADRLAVAGVEQKGSIAAALSIVAPGTPAGSDVVPSQAWVAFDEFDL